MLDGADDDPVIASGMLGDNLALEGREGIGEKRNAVASWLPVEVRESVSAGGGRAYNEPLMISS